MSEWTSQKSQLLLVFFYHGALTSKQAAEYAELQDSEYWVRCHELWQEGLLDWAYEEIGARETTDEHAGIYYLTKAGKQHVIKHIRGLDD